MSEEVQRSSEEKDYQTLFYVPMIFQTSQTAEAQIDEMLQMIADFHVKEDKQKPCRTSILVSGKGGNKRRQQILGDMLDSEVVKTRVDVVLKSDSTKYCILSVLKQHFLFSQLHDYELEDVIDSMQSYNANEGEVIIKEGNMGDYLYILEEGVCDIEIGGSHVGTLDEPAAFGDLALMYNCPRAATITAVTDCALWTLDRVFFRQAMVTSSSNQNVQLSQFLSKISLFESLGIQSLNQLARSLTRQSYEDGQYIIRQGEIGEKFYVIHKGTVTVTIMDDSGDEITVSHLKAGDVFGERALIKKEPRAANIISEGDCECYYLESQDFSSMLGEIVDKLNKLNEFRVLRATPLFHLLSENRLKLLQESFHLQSMYTGQRIVCDSMNIVIVMDGQLESGNTGSKFATSSSVGDAARAADSVAGSLTCISNEATIVTMDRQLLLDHIAFEAKEGLDPSDPLQSPQGDKKPTTSEVELQANKMRRASTAAARRQSVAQYFSCSSLNDLQVVQPLGRGTFGSVYMARHTRTGKTMALKCLDKKALMVSSQHQYVRREVIALQSFNHPFIGEYYGFIPSPRKAFLMLEFISGGELWSYLYKEATPLTSNGPVKGPYGGLSVLAATLYAATVLLALEHIHNQGYIYRDLKPENMLFSSNGYVKLVDFGFAKPVPFVNKSKQVQYRTFTLCGTPEYMATEVVLTQGHDKSADYWSFGILVYELLCGRTPFEGRNQQRTFEKIVHSQKYLPDAFPAGFDPHSKSLIRRLLHPNAALRLGALQNGFDDIKSHVFFAMQFVDFDKLLAQEVEMPYIPEPFKPSTSSSDHTVDVEMIDLNLETNIVVEESYSSYFDYLDSVDVSED